MKKNIACYMMMAANAIADQPLTPVECDMLSKFLQGETNLAD